MPAVGQKSSPAVSSNGRGKHLPSVVKKESIAPGKRKATERPKLVNRGAAGLLTRLTEEQKAGIVPRDDSPPPKTKRVARYRIAPDLKHMAVGIDSLEPDPVNARLHPDNNMAAIRESLETYGQVKPIVVRRDRSIIVAGNGTWRAAKELGWDEIAVHWVEMDDVEAAGYGLADNKTAELAKWDLEVVATLDRLLVEAGLPTTGWSEDELTVLRAADWTPPTVSDEEFSADGDGLVAVKVTPEVAENIKIATSMLREQTGNKKLTEGEALATVVDEWLFPEHREERVNAASG